MLALVFGAAAGTYAARASTGFARNLRHDMYYAVQDFSFSNIDKFSTGSIVTRLTTDVTNVQNAFQMCTRIAVRCPVMLIFALVHGRIRSTANMALIFLARAAGSGDRPGHSDEDCRPGLRACVQDL